MFETFKNWFVKRPEIVEAINNLRDKTPEWRHPHGCGNIDYTEFDAYRDSGIFYGPGMILKYYGPNFNNFAYTGTAELLVATEKLDCMGQTEYAVLELNKAEYKYLKKAIHEIHARELKEKEQKRKVEMQAQEKEAMHYLRKK
jgi:hypothetical protein